MDHRRTARDANRSAPWSVCEDNHVENDRLRRPRDLIRTQRPRATEWAVFNDFEDDIEEERQQCEPSRRPCAPRNSLVRQRPTTWRVVDPVDDHDKENVGYVVRRPTRAIERPLVVGNSTITTRNAQDTNLHDHHANTQDTPPMPTTVATPRSKGKRKLQTTPTETTTPTPPPPKKKAKVSKKQPKKTKTKKTSDVDAVAVRAEEPAIAPVQHTVRRPLEDITHLFLDPTAFYFQPWRRASSVATRASSMRIL